ncbi:MAG: hypothetical protein COV74_04375 [Candidatus Omnitrophica bacterium CG11_big_fil_rev_8_21_14_0_20_45_26]|uniref:Uncharacterized protein n=1 Tax=Candidatus Abzuiibacterium crystallinum TaxID=1974748 RepID=A0A2H0LQ71_9BACT|nr:MAG: hypothetical protein COV74_04375 [Candidatus Omnitrophica bacterium CG11_big_fil_rev_8_21_14_0_20_45_26]PIW64265.1 MAG: hypothetical protein COW12_06895 [Candidatus Omnitrophica bacterium CG12_big_fil_rev_8_21_14_0_65_45_16]
MMAVQELIKEEPGKIHLENHFRCYFHNKMAILLMMIERPDMIRNTEGVEREKAALNDLEHYFLPFGKRAKYRRIFKWLKLFLEEFPHTSSVRLRKAFGMVASLYEAFGFRMYEC